MRPFLGILRVLRWLFPVRSTVMFVFTPNGLWVIQCMQKVWSGTISLLPEP